MIPENRLSSEALPGDYYVADALPRVKLQDFELGGPELNNATVGLTGHIWEVYTLGNEVRVRLYPNQTPTVLFSSEGLERLGLAFDQSMRPAVSFVSNGTTKLFWYDPVPTEQRNVITAYPGTRDPVICVDDRRPELPGLSDILLFYLKDELGNPVQHLYMRQQRDRYTIEYDLGPLPTGTTNLSQVGMGKNGRLRFELFGQYEVPNVANGPLNPFPPEVGPNPLILQFRSAPYLGDNGNGSFQFPFVFYLAPESFPLE